MTIFIGTAGWSIPREFAGLFPEEGSALERYAANFSVAEINSSFHRPHRLSTWQRWRDSVPDRFRFSVKLPKQITHQRKLVDCEGEVDGFLEEVAELGAKLAVILVQLPPKHEFDAALASHFFALLASRSAASLVCEPRHLSWFSHEADSLLDRLQVARVAADPPLCAAAAQPGGWSGVRYWRLHGSPAMYRSSYSDRIGDYAARLMENDGPGRDLWCIFDNTASSAAVGDALSLITALNIGH
jgi:uncharacterized protein YecE (DUF72 family)